MISMIKHRKTISLGLLLFFTLPIATAFCCCTESTPNSSCQEMLGHHQGANESKHDHGRHHHDKKDGLPESCECGHEVIAEVAGRTIDFSTSNLAVSKFQFQSVIARDLSTEVHKQALPFHDTGPPGARFSSTPLYLQISVLRI